MVYSFKNFPHQDKNFKGKKKSQTEASKYLFKIKNPKIFPLSFK